MYAITSICDEAACILVDPLNKKYSSNTHYIACALTILLGVATYGVAQAVSVIWRTLRQIEENETLEIITNLFIRIILSLLENEFLFDSGHEALFDDESAQAFHPEQFYKDTSTYTVSQLRRGENGLSMSVVRKGLKEVPDFHLHQLAQSIEKGNKTQSYLVSLSVQFLRDDLKPLLGLDGGGLTRDFIDDLFEGIVQSPKFSFLNLQNSSLVLPQTKEEVKNCQALPQLDIEEQTLYQEMGKVMMFFYHSNLYDYVLYFTGRRFAEALFNATLCLTAEEIDSSFDTLSMETKLKICRALLDGHSNAGMDLTYLQKRCDWLEDFDQLDSDQLLEAAMSLLHSEFLPDDFTIDHKGEEPDLKQIQQNLAVFKEMLIASILCQKGIHGQLGAQLAPIHAIAQGMKSLCLYRHFSKTDRNDHWNTEFCSFDYEKFSTTIQGVLDRDQIVQLFQVNPHLQEEVKEEIEKKVGWLNEWIIDKDNGATEDELKRLLKFMTGSTSFRKDVNVKVYDQCDTPYCPVPTVSTCYLQMHLAPQKSQYGKFNDHTKENFIESLKELALRNPSSYQNT